MWRLQEFQGELVIASIVWHELWFGCHRLAPSRKRQKIERYLHEVVSPFIPLLPYTQTAAEWHAEERDRLVSIGKTPSFADGQIASIAKTNRLILVTANVSDYENFHGLFIEDWFLPEL